MLHWFTEAKVVLENDILTNYQSGFNLIVQLSTSKWKFIIPTTIIYNLDKGKDVSLSFVIFQRHLIKYGTKPAL